MIKESARRPEADQVSNIATARICGVLLAAGAGRRAGGPKALRVDPDGTSWLLRSIAVLREGGCDAVIVVLGCEAARARDLLASSTFAADPIITAIDAPDWQLGMASSLYSGLVAAQLQQWRAVLVHLVDLPDVTAEVVRRVIGQAPPGTACLGSRHLRRAARPPGLHRPRPSRVASWSSLTGDSGARHYLAEHGVSGVECGDLASGQDHDTSWQR